MNIVDNVHKPVGYNGKNQTLLQLQSNLLNNNGLVLSLKQKHNRPGPEQ